LIQAMAGMCAWLPVSIQGGSARSRETVASAFDGDLPLVPVGEHDVWAFITTGPGRSGRDAPVLADRQEHQICVATQAPDQPAGFAPIGGYARPVIARKGIHPMSTADGGAEWWYHP
jgi:hypothetical protein